jgi:hypothetical protein
VRRGSLPGRLGWVGLLFFHQRRGVVSWRCEAEGVHKVESWMSFCWIVLLKHTPGACMLAQSMLFMAIDHSEGKRGILFVLSWHCFEKKMAKESDGDHGGRFLRKNHKDEEVITW